MRFVIALAALAIVTGCTMDAEPLSASEKADMAAMKELVRKCDANPPKAGTQAAVNCGQARQITFFKPPTLEEIRAQQRAASSAGR